MRVFGGCASDIGRVRKMNQDGILFRCLEQKGQCFAVGAVCDGVGGLENGELASAMIIGEINRWVESVGKWIDISAIEPKTLYSHLKDQAENWNEMLFSYRTFHNLNTGTTMSIIMLIRNYYYVIHVGDSRIYRYRDSLKQLTEDECQTRLINGRIKNYLDNYMGKSKELQFQSREGQSRDGDLFLYCSDGYYHYMTVEDVKKIKEMGMDNRKISEYSRKMIKRVMERGETDNISLGIMHVKASIQNNTVSFRK